MKEVFADLTTDLVFKKAFASEQDKELLINLLNAFLECKLKHPITDVTIKNPYIQGETLENKDSIVDIRCKDSEDNHFIVEMQVSLQHFFIKISNFTPMENDEYIRRAMFRTDLREQLRYAKDEGAKERDLQIAKDMLADGLDIARVARITKLSEDQVMALR